MSGKEMNKRRSVVYSLLHAVFWCSYAISWSYTAVYLKSCGYSNMVIGFVTGIGAVISVLAQPIMAFLVKKISILNTRRNIIVFKIAALILTVGIMFHFPGAVTAVFFTFVAAVDASIPSMLSSLAMESVNHGKYINYGLSRGIGSISYAAFSLILGYVVSVFSEESLMYLYLIMSAATLFVTMIMPKEMKEYKNHSVQDEELEKKVRINHRKCKSQKSIFAEYPFLLLFLISSVFLFMGHNMVNVFLINIMERAGGTSENLGITLAISACVELPVMSCFVFLVKKIKVEKLLIFSAVFFTLKSIGTVVATTMWMIYGVYFLQFGAFALFTPASVYFINQKMKSKDSGVGQALLGSCSLGLGGALGNAVGGILLDRIGLTGMLITTVALSVVGVLFMVLSISKIEKVNI